MEFFLRLSRTLDVDTEDKDRVPDATLREVAEAHRWLADRGSGKAVESLELSGPDGGPVDVRVCVYSAEDSE